MRVVNVITCELDDSLERGDFRCQGLELAEQLGASVIGAGIYEMRSGEKRGPYHFHHGVEEWMYVIAGTPILRDPSGERPLQPGDLVGFTAGPQGAHTMHGPGRIIMFSTGARGWGEAFVTVYPDSDKVGAAPGVMFRCRDALESWSTDAMASSLDGKDAIAEPASAPAIPVANVLSMAVSPSLESPTPGAVRSTGMLLRPPGSRTWAAALHALAPGEAAEPYHYGWCRERWALVLSGTPVLRHAKGEETLRAGDIICCPEGPAGAHRIRNDEDAAARVITFTSPIGRPMSAFYPDDGNVLVHIPGHESFLFRETDQLDYWDGEPGA